MTSRTPIVSSYEQIKWNGVRDISISATSNRKSDVWNSLRPVRRPFRNASGRNVESVSWLHSALGKVVITSLSGFLRRWGGNRNSLKEKYSALLSCYSVLHKYPTPHPSPPPPLKFFLLCGVTSWKGLNWDLYHSIYIICLAFKDYPAMSWLHKYWPPSSITFLPVFPDSPLRRDRVRASIRTDSSWQNDCVGRWTTAPVLPLTLDQFPRPR